MNLSIRNITVAIISILFTQLIFSCSTHQLQSSENDYNSHNELEIAQINLPKTGETEEPYKSNNVESSENINALVIASAGTEKGLINTQKFLPVKIAAESKNTHAENSISQNGTKRKYSAGPSKSPTKDKPKGKNQWIALILAFLLGAYGAHRFYLGRTKSAILQLALIILALLAFIAALIIFIPLEAPVIFLSLYAFGFILAIINSVWVIIDIVNILTGSLKPKDGEYTETINF